MKSTRSQSKKNRVNRQTKLRNVRGSAGILTVGILSVMQFHSILQAASTTWSGGGSDTNWATPGNWSNGAPDTLSTWDLAFAGSTGTTNFLNIGGASATITASSIVFSNTSTSVFTLSASNSRTITLTNGATVSTASGGSAGPRETINIPLTLSGSAIFNAAGHDLQLGSFLSGGTIVKNGANNLYFNNGSNCNIIGNAGTLYYTSGVTSGTCTLNGASFVGATGSHPVVFSLLQNASIRSYTGASGTFTAPAFNIPSGAASNVTLTLGSASGATPDVIQGAIQDNTSKTVALNVQWGGAVWVLSGSNSFSGGTTITAANTVKVNSPTALGASTGNVTVQSGAVLDIYGTVMTNTNALTISGTGIAGGALINSSGTAATYPGLVKLGATSTVLATSGDIILSNTGTIIGSGFGLTVGGAKNTTIAGIIGTGIGTLTKQDAGILTLSGSNTYSGATTVSGGILDFQNTSAKSASTSVTVGASASLGLGVGGAGYFSSTDVDNLFASGTIAGVSMNAASGVGIDTSAGDFTYATSQSAARGLTKLGANVLSLTGANSYGTTTISQGVLQIGNGGTSGSLGAGAVANNGNLYFNRTDGYGGAIGNTMSGSGGVTLAGGTLTLSGSNNYTGGTAISAGTLKMGSAWALGGSNSTVTVASGAVLDVAGITGTTSNPYALTISGSGISGGGSLVNTSGTAANFYGAVTLGGDSTIKTTGASIYLGNGIGGSYVLTVDGNNQLDVNGAIQTSSVVKLGTGALRLESSNPFGGGLWVKNGQVIAKNVNALGGNGAGTVYLGDTAGSNWAYLSLGVTGTCANPVIVQAGSSNFVQLDNYANYVATLSGSLTLNRVLTLNSGNQSLTLSGAISGTGGLIIQANIATSQVILSGSNSFSGNTTMTPTNAATLQLANGFALQNSTLDTGVSGSQSVVFAVTGTNTYYLGGLQGSNGLPLGANTINAGANGANTTYSGGISGSGGLIKSGTGMLTLAGSNTYTGPTSIQSGTLMLGAGGTTGSIAAASVVSFANNAVLGVNRSNSAVQGVDFPGPLSGAGGLAQLGSGTTTLNAANTHSGGTVLSAGQLNIAVASSATSSAIGTGPLTINGGTLDNTSGADVTLQTNNPQAWNGGFTYAGSANNLDLGTGAVVLGGTNTFPSLTVSSGTLTVGGSITGYGYGLYKYGNGTLALNGSNNLTGTFVLFGGSVQLGNSNALSRNFQIGGSATNPLTFGSGVGTVNIGYLFGGLANQSIALTDNGGNPVALSLGASNYSSSLPFALTGLGGLSKVGTGTLTLTGTNTYAGTTTISGGTLSVSGSQNLGTSASLLFDGGTLQYTGASATSLSGFTFSFTPGKAVGFDAAQNLTVSQSLTQGSGGLNKWGGNSLTLSGSNSYSGPTTVYTGRMMVGATSALGTSSVQVMSGANLYLTANIANDITLSGSGFAEGGVPNGALRIDGRTTTGIITLAGNSRIANIGSATDTIAGQITGSNALEFCGAALGNNATNTFILSSTSNNWTGNTTISCGDYSTVRTGVVTVLQLGASNVIPDGVGMGNIVFTGSDTNHLTILDMNGKNDTVNGFNLAGSPTAAFIQNSLASTTGTLSVGSGDTSSSFSGTIRDNGGAGGRIAIVKTGAGALTLSGSNSYGGGTTVSGGLLQVGNANALGTGALTVNGGTLDLAGNSVSVGTLSGASGGISNLAGGMSTLTTVASGNGTYAGCITDGTGTVALTRSGGGTLTLSGSNSYSGPTTVNQGTLVFQNTSAMSASSTVTASATATVALGVGGAGYYAATDVDALFANTFAGITLDPVSSVGIDTSAGNFTYATSQSSVRGLAKLGANTLILTGSNSYGATTISQGVLQVGNGGASGSLGTGAVTNNANLTFNRTDNYGGVIGNTIAGTGSVTLAGGTLTLSGSNSYTGGTQINAGALKMGSATALGGSNAAVSVASGAVLDLAGTVGNSTNPYALTIAGSGSSGGGALTNSSGTAAIYFGAVTLAGDSTISTAAGFITLGSFANALGISGSHVLTVGGIGQLDVFGAIQTASVVKTGWGALRLESSNSFAGGLWVKSGAAVAKNVNALGGNGSGTVYLGDTAGANNANLSFGAGTVTFFNPVVVQAGNSGVMTIDNYANYSPTVAGGITLNKSLTLYNTNTSGVQSLTVSGAISGTGGLAIAGSTAANPVILSGSNSFSGNTTMFSGSAATLQIANVYALQNSTLDTGASGSQSVVFTVSGTNTYHIGGLQGSNGLAIGANTIDVGSNGANTTYSGAISGSGGVTKSGSGTLILSGSIGINELSAGAGEVALTQSGSIDTLNVYDTATVALSANTTGTRSVLSVSSLSFGGSFTNMADSSAAPARLNADSLNGNTSTALLASAAPSGIEPAAPESVPEPGTLGLLLAGAIGLLRIRRKGGA